ncbi:LysR substrate-binding domain-containing protein [Leucobacter aridicollis]|uniref:LysR substrate-binding domain-containing protein n=1 Tax=Leucobacter aridicollis TaxID=283878 RepID=UPI000E65D4E0|nr:LysR substrate-binding domain-containing protein [Leucobacter aridicollis]UTX54337.1 LysR family transcriptional regulator [Leucobacter aridicollis]
MEIGQVRAFLAVAEHLHFGRAAESLRIAQPYLSRVIRQLEAQLGGELFERSTRSVALTEMGRVILPPMRAALHAMEHADRAARDAVGGQIGRVRIALGGYATHEVLGELVRLVRERHPGIRIEIVSELYGVNAIDAVLDDKVDLGILRVYEDLPGIRSRLLRTESFLLAVPEGSELAEKDYIAFADLANEPFITLAPEFAAAMERSLHIHARAAGFIPRVVQVSPDSKATMVFVAAGLGISLVVDAVREHLEVPGVVFKELVDHLPPLELRVVWRAESQNPALMRVLRLLPVALHQAS